MLGCLTIRPAVKLSPENRPSSDNARPSDLHNYFPFWSVQQVFCELSQDLCLFIFCAVWQALRFVVAEPDPLSGRDAYRLIDSVKSYLLWRLKSRKRPFTSWRNQPPEVCDLTAALHLINQAWNASPAVGFEQAEELRRLTSGIPQTRRIELLGRDLAERVSPAIAPCSSAALSPKRRRSYFSEDGERDSI